MGHEILADTHSARGEEIHPTIDYFVEEALFDDPYPIFDRLRSEAPIYFDVDSEAYILTRWEDCETVLNDPDTFGAMSENLIAPSTHRALGGSPSVLTVDGPVHDDLRQAVDAPLRPRAVKAHTEAIVKPAVAARIEYLRTLGDGPVDLMDVYFEPISVRAVGGVLGLDGVDDDRMRMWFSGIISGLLNTNCVEEDFADSDKASADMSALLRPVIARVAAEPDDSAISHMVNGGREPGNPRTAEELLPSIHVYVAGGMQEPGHGAGSAMLGLLNNPDQLARLAANPSLVSAATEEGLRWIAPLGHADRQANVDVEINGTKIPAGSKLFAMLGAANRDPERFEYPHEYNIDRAEGKQMAFGGGRHFCAGNALGRSIIKASLHELIAAFPNIRLDPDQEPIINGWHFRSPRTLPVLLK